MAVTFGLAAASAVTACGSSDSSETGSGAKATASAPTGAALERASGAIRVGSQLTKEIFDPMVAAFEKAHPSVKVKVTYASTDAYPKVIQTQVQAGNAPDVFQADPGTGWQTPLLQFAKAGRLVDLSAQPWVSKISSTDKPLVELDGKTYAYPVDSAPQMVLYNPDLFKTAGVAVPKTFDELLRACQTFKAEGVTPVAFAGNGTASGGTVSMLIASNILFSSDRDWTQKRADGQTTFADTTQWKQVLQDVQRMKHAGCFADNAVTQQIPQTMGDFTGAKAAMFPAPAQAIGFLPFFKPKFEVSSFPWPGDTADQTIVPAGPSTSFAVNAKSSNQAAAVAFVNWLSEPEQQATWAKSLGSLSPTQAASGELPPILASVAPYYTDRKVIAYPNSSWPSPELVNELAKGVQGILTGQDTVGSTVTSLDRIWDQAAKTTRQP